MTPLEGALEMAELGFRVFPLRANTKSGQLIRSWKTSATTDRDTIERWAARWPGCNWGMSCWGLIVIDMDLYKDGARETINDLDLHDFVLPPTRMHGSARGGVHMIYRLPPGTGDLAQIALGPGVDVRVQGGYVVCPGSIFEGKPYTVSVEYHGIAEAPGWLVTRLTPLVRPVEPAPVDHVPNTPGILDRAFAWLANAVKPHQGSRGGDTYKMACRLRELGVTEDVATSMVLDFWAPECVPPLDDWEARASVEHAYSYAQNAAGSQSPDLDFADLPDIIEVPALPAPSLLMSPTEGYNLNAPYLIKGVLGPGDTAFLYGPSTVGKTFLALHLAWHLAQGKTVFNRRVKRAAVLYVNFEGRHGFRNRAELATRTHGDAGDWLKLMTISPTLARADGQKQGVKLIAKAALELQALTGSPYGLVVIDTMARATAGNDENSASDGAEFAGRIASIIGATGYSVLVVHHPGKDASKGMRGTGAAFAAADCVLRIDHDSVTGLRTLDAEKVKDGPKGVVGPFRLETSVLGVDADGDDVTSCVVSEVGRDDRTELAKSIAMKLLTENEASEKPANLSPNPKARGWYAAKRFADSDEGKAAGITVEDFAEALGWLERAGSLYVEEHGHARDGCRSERYILGASLETVG